MGGCCHVSSVATARRNEPKQGLVVSLPQALKEAVLPWLSAPRRAGGNKRAVAPDVVEFRMGLGLSLFTGLYSDGRLRHPPVVTSAVAAGAV